MASSGESEGETFEVGTILDQRKRGRGVEYLVRWRGFGEEEDSWEPGRNLRHAQDAIDRFIMLKNIKMTPRKGEKSHTQTTVTSSKSGGVSTKTTRTKTVITSGTKSEFSSPEASPQTTRRATRTSTMQVTTSKSKGHAVAKPGFLKRHARGILQLTRHDIPIVILIACLLVIAISFAIDH